jgi:hypothetical protein
MTYHIDEYAMIPSHFLSDLAEIPNGDAYRFQCYCDRVVPSSFDKSTAFFETYTEERGLAPASTRNGDVVLEMDGWSGPLVVWPIGQQYLFCGFAWMNEDAIWHWDNMPKRLLPDVELLRLFELTQNGMEWKNGTTNSSDGQCRLCDTLDPGRVTTHRHEHFSLPMLES